MHKAESNRVVVRQGARELTKEELESVIGALQTATKCTLDPLTGHTDGDHGEC